MFEVQKFILTAFLRLLWPRLLSIRQPFPTRSAPFFETPFYWTWAILPRKSQVRLTSSCSKCGADAGRRSLQDLWSSRSPRPISTGLAFRRGSIKTNALGTLVKSFSLIRLDEFLMGCCYSLMTPPSLSLADTAPSPYSPALSKAYFLARPTSESPLLVFP